MHIVGTLIEELLEKLESRVEAASIEAVIAESFFFVSIDIHS